MSCARLDRDQAFIVQDFGPRGFVGPVVVNLTQGLQPGGTLTVVASTDHSYFIDVSDAKKEEKLIHLGARPVKDDLVFNSFLKGAWGLEERPTSNPILKGVRASITFVYEETGYRIFINGKEVLFYKHRTTKPPSSVECTNGQFYKVAYMNQMELIPM